MATQSNHYAYHNIHVALGGKMTAGAVQLEVSQELDAFEVHVQGTATPATLLQGPQLVYGVITLTYNEYDALQASIPNGKSLLDMEPINMVITRMGANQQLKTDLVTKLRFERVQKSYKAGKAVATLDLNFAAEDVRHNV